MWAVLAGDAFKAISAAVAAGKTSGDDIAAWLHSELKDYPALSGSLGFDAKGDRVGEFYRVYEVNDTGNFVLQPR